MPDELRKEVTLAELKKDISHLTSEVTELKTTVTTTLSQHEHRLQALELQAADQHDVYVDKQIIALQQSRETCMKRFEEMVSTAELLKMEMRLSNQIDQLLQDMKDCNKETEDRLTAVEDKVRTHNVWIYILSGSFMVGIAAAINFGFKILDKISTIP